MEQPRSSTGSLMESSSPRPQAMPLGEKAISDPKRAFALPRPFLGLICGTVGS
jgi:hypothetical protein